MIDNYSRIVFTLFVLSGLVVGLVRSARKRRAFIAEHGKTDAPTPVLWEGVIRMRYQLPNERWHPLKVFLYLRVSPTIVRIAAPPWQYVRGVGPEWGLPTDTLTMKVEAGRITLQGAETALVMFSGRRQGAVVDALARAGVRRLS